MTYFAVIQGDGEAGQVLCGVCASEHLEHAVVLMDNPDPVKRCSVCSLAPVDFCEDPQMLLLRRQA